MTDQIHNSSLWFSCCIWQWLFLQKSPDWWKSLEQANCGIYLGDKYLKINFLWNLLFLFVPLKPLGLLLDAKSGFPWKKQSKNTITVCMKPTSVVVLPSFFKFSVFIFGNIPVQIHPQIWRRRHVGSCLIVNMNYESFFQEHKCNVLFVSCLTVVPCLWLFAEQRSSRLFMAPRWNDLMSLFCLPCTSAFLQT